MYCVVLLNIQLKVRTVDWTSQRWTCIAKQMYIVFLKALFKLIMMKIENKCDTN